MADVPVPSIATATPAAADTVLGVQGGAVKRFSVDELAAVGEFVQSGTGAVARSVQAKLREVEVSIVDFGAVGDGTTDNTDAVNRAAAAVRGGVNDARVLTIPAGVFYVSGELDLTRCRYIKGIGEIMSGVTAGAAVTIGTTSNANVDMDCGEIRLNVRSSAANNSALAAVSGIRVRGAARASFELYSYGWGTGVELAPDDSVGTQYVAWCGFRVYTNACFTGLKFNAQNGGFINENLFTKCDCYPQNNAIAGDTIGVHMTGSYSSDNNRFMHGCFEGQPIPIWIEKGTRNAFMGTRLESAGAVRFGSSSASGDQDVYNNVIQASYTHSRYGVAVDWQCTRPNLVANISQDSAWLPEVAVNFDDFITVAGKVYSTKLKNSTTGDGFFNYGVLNSATRSFVTGSNHRAYVRLKVGKGDVFRVHYSRVDSETPAMTIRAIDASGADLGDILSSEVPYLGSDLTSAASATSGTLAYLNVNNAVFNVPFLLSVNRDEVEYIDVQLTASAQHRSLMIERLARGGQENDARLGQFTPIQGVSTFTGSPSIFPGQIAVADASRAALATTGGAWVQVGQVPVSATAAAIASVANAVNTTNKVAGLVVRDTTNNRLMFASGPNPTDAWYVADGSASVTPA